MSHADSTGAPKRRGRGLTALASAIAGIPLALAVQPSPGEAKAPGVSHCYRSICHRVRTVEQTRRMIGRSFTVETSYYDLPGRDRFNTGTYTSNGERFDANDSARVASADLPDGTELLLRNPANGRVSHVRVNDFGPFRGNRRLDVTRRVAEDLDFKHKGVVRLDVIVIAAPGDDDLTYRRNRERRATRGHLGVVFDTELPALVAALVGEPGPTGEVGAVTAAAETARRETGLPGGTPASGVIAVAQRRVSETAAFEKLIDAGWDGHHRTIPSLEATQARLVVLTGGDETDAAAAPAAELAVIEHGGHRDVAAVKPELAGSQLGSIEASADASGPHLEAGPQSPSDAPGKVMASLATATLATSDFGAGSSSIEMSREMLFALLATLLSGFVAISLATRDRGAERVASARRPGSRRQPTLIGRTAQIHSTTRIPTATHTTSPPAATAKEPNVTQPPASQSAPRAATYIAADLAFDGVLRSKGRVEVAGKLTGRIEADELVVLPGGAVEGEANCRLLTVSGAFSGSISAHEVHVRDAGHIDADVECSAVTVAMGALLEGHVRRRKPG